MSLTSSPVFWILAALAAGGVFVFVERFMELRRAKTDCTDFIKGVVNLLDRGNEDEALAICEDTPVPVARVVAAAIRHRKSSVLALREAVDVCGRSESNRLERRIALLAVIGDIAPLIGLMGTIFGFIRTVMLLNGSAIVSRVDLLGTAVSTLVLAGMGLAVAIPVAVMYATLRLRLDRIISDLESAATEIVAYLGSKGSRA